MGQLDELKYILDKYNITTMPKHSAPIVLPICREEMAVLFKELDYKRGAEIGVAEGYYSDVLCRSIPHLALYCIDAWRPYSGYQDHTSKSKLDGFYDKAQARLLPYDATLIRKFSMEAVWQFKDEYFDFVYIDAAHDFLNVTQDIAMWSQKVRQGGIVAGHDYRRSKTNYTCKVKDVVPSWVYAHGINPWFVTDEPCASWMWVKA